MLSLILRILRSNKTALGRWECTGHKENKIKIDWANIDHCGTCSYKSEPKRLDNIPIKHKQHKNISIIAPKS